MLFVPSGHVGTVGAETRRPRRGVGRRSMPLARSADLRCPKAVGGSGSAPRFWPSSAQGMAGPNHSPDADRACPQMPLEPTPTPTVGAHSQTSVETAQNMVRAFGIRLFACTTERSLKRLCTYDGKSRRAPAEFGAPSRRRPMRRPHAECRLLRGRP